MTDYYEERYAAQMKEIAAAEARDRAAGCNCPEDAKGWWDCVDCPVHGKEASAEGDAEHAAEMAAEYAWLRHAENQGWDDDPRGW